MAFEEETVDDAEVLINKEFSKIDVNLTLDSLLSRAFSSVFYPDDRSSTSPFSHRIRAAFTENAPRVKNASANSGRKILQWTRDGSRFRALFVISIGTIVLLILTGLLVFTLFFIAATVNALVVSLLMSIAAAGGFLAFFFVCVTAIYIGALSVAVFTISTATVSAVIAVIVATGWIGFFWCVWLVAQRAFGIARHSISVTGSAISAFSERSSSTRYNQGKMD